ncbi:type IV pilus biogenesis protein PilM [Serratia ureilytica]|uniref:Type IV pilus biogenesis protein PilM n=1 Tax=Serratia ureilytica TaxID=300181 RepID=A0ABU0VS28_9GAMM|nr:type IV pilus biogenesis protein PilM [Serratia ureilytica]MCU7063473.1 type IV pilus biogenesis protein PilM [Serratia ureilytica]MDQ1811519.1 type IV pilus biogenesis protein PilM [Serratia ureilytica]MDQ1840627.1 type IV pilus biogenesis protein PilM [Serratia ureilytica]MDQ1864240.1 type IV pilus biogenesis protein PilM [Serratia ureilytica]
MHHILDSALEGNLMFYWILSVFLGFLVLVNISPHDQAGTQLQDSTLSQRAIQTIRYINDINDWRYINPAQKDGVIPDSALGWSSVGGLRNVLQADRVYVYQPDQPGLMAALLAQSRHSALVGKVVGRRLIDSVGNDMQVNVPASITDGSLVYLN